MMDQSPRAGLPLASKTLAGFIAAIVAVLLITVLSYQSLQATASTAQALARSIDLLGEFEGLLSSLKDAETGQRGYLLTGAEAYLEPYLSAEANLPGEFRTVRALLADRPQQLQRIEALQAVATLKMQELASTLVPMRAGNQVAALAIVKTDRGKAYMEQIRSIVADMESAERQLIAERGRAAKAAATLALGVIWGGSGLLLLLIAGSAAVAASDHRSRQAETWQRNGQIRLSEVMQGDQPLDQLGAKVLQFLARFVEAQVAAIYIAEAGGFRRVAGYAIPGGSDAVLLRAGDGLVGQVVRDQKTAWVRDVPDGYMPIGSATGQGTPRELLVVPASIDHVVHAVLEFGFFEPTEPSQRDLLSRVSETIAVAVRAATDRQRLEELLQVTQQQSEELQAGQEELRVSNEELEEQSRALRESQSSLESQQSELEQINSQLEEQSQQLEHQRDALAKAHGVLSARSTELQRANEYKSEFLANMSHELRTPLNSTLILAKLLADNKDGNLTAQQVKFAQTITSAGNDLLTLINDVLDLSRIEAGKVDLAPEIVSMSSIVDSLSKTFQPTADQNKIRFAVAIDLGVPETIHTDPQRLGQILKNLLSNAFKFTEKGEVALRIFVADPGTVSFAVRDSGVGIALHQQEVIFEAFRQADGSIHRKFGGTGLGLSISRDLATLLGGTLTVQSEVDRGSVFTCTLPVAYGGAAAQPAAARTAMLDVAVAVAAAPAPAAMATKDDRDSMTPGGRSILLIEDDANFAMIMRDLVNEMGFQCIATASAGDGLIAAAKFQPSAILLDMHLPDHSGLGVLDQLKREPATRHIPVHVISVADHRREALELGAVGYAFKPTKREELIEALRKLEKKFSQSLRHVLVVEDDARQRESIRQLLSNGDVQITAVASASDAMLHLKASTFDCMVVDFNLPDYSGYDLLEKMARGEDVSFPPVIVYTGRALTRDEEQRLRRFSNSIIIKDARSPERLLDEVTLFLHQVESKLPPERQLMLKTARNRDTALEGRRVLVVEDDVRNIFALSSVLEPKGVTVLIARNGRESLEVLARSVENRDATIDLVLMDIMMPEMDGLTAMREIRKQSQWKQLPIIALTAKAMTDDQEKCIAAGANDYIAKPLDVEKLLSLVRVWMPK